MTTTTTASPADRSAAYGRVQTTLFQLGPSKLLDEELTAIREVADALMFGDDDAAEQLAAASALLGTLVDSGRWLAPTARKLFDDLTACQP